MNARLLAVVALLFGTGCATRMVPFTQELRAQHELTDSEVKGLQFYLSDDVKLRRELERDNRRVVGGNLEVTTGKLVEEVLVEEQTPGVVVAMDELTLSVSFEEGTSLSFSVARPARPALPLVLHESRYAEPPDPFPGRAPAKRADDTATLLGNYWLVIGADGVVSFGGRPFEAVEGSHRAHLLIDAESLEEVAESRTVLKGRTVGTR